MCATLLSHFVSFKHNGRVSLMHKAWLRLISY